MQTELTVKRIRIKRGNGREGVVSKTLILSVASIWLEAGVRGGQVLPVGMKR